MVEALAASRYINVQWYRPSVLHWSLIEREKFLTRHHSISRPEQYLSAQMKTEGIAAESDRLADNWNESVRALDP